MLRHAAAGAVLAGVYGVVHDQGYLLDFPGVFYTPEVLAVPLRKFRFAPSGLRSRDWLSGHLVGWFHCWVVYDSDFRPNIFGRRYNSAHNTRIPDHLHMRVFGCNCRLCAEPLSWPRLFGMGGDRINAGDFGSAQFRACRLHP